MYEWNSIRVIEPSDDAETVNFEDSDLPILHRSSGWMLRYLGAGGQPRDHLVAGEIDDIELVLEQAQAYLRQSPPATAWPHT
jgi:hypothetical protein